MKKFLIILLPIFSLSTFPGFASAESATGVVYCFPGTASSNVPLDGAPTYDYGPDGLVRFHFKMLGELTGNNNPAVALTFSSYFNSNCQEVNTTYSTSNFFFPNVANLMLKAEPAGTGTFNFVAYNEDSGQPESSFSASLPNLNADDIVQFSFSIWPSYTAYYYGIGVAQVATPAVSVVGPNYHPANQKIPVLIVPGIMGTEINKGNETLWPDVGRMLNPVHSDSFMDPMSFQKDGTSLDTSLKIGQVLNQVGTLDYTKNLVNDLVNKENYILGTNLFLFPYDWRRDIKDVATKDDPLLQNPSLKQIIDEILLSSGSNKIDIIAHSQGGLVTKRLLVDLPQYQNKINKLIFVGTPNLGAPMAGKVLLYGDDMDVSFAGMGLDPQEVKNISQNMPSIYELLPSREYFNHINGYLGTAQVGSLGLLHVSTLNSTDTTQYLKDQNLNSGLIDSANSFHSSTYDNFDFSPSGAQIYSIVGCQAGTPGKIAVKADGDFQIIPVAGDGTVPVFSASNIPGAATYFALESSHGAMLTEDGIRQQIINLVSGDNLSTNNKISQNISDCHFDGTQVSAHSPVTLDIYDSLGRHVGPTPDGGFDSEIPNVGYSIIGHDKFAYLPAGTSYTVKLKATDNGSFSFYSSQIQNSQITNTAYYNQIPITASSSAQINLNSANNQTIQLDANGDGTVDQIIQPSSVINSSQSEDLTPPISTSTISGVMGEPGFYRSSVNISLSAMDPVENNDPSQTAGILNIKYNLDNSGYQVYNTSTPIAVASEGQHTLSFFSTDRAGNSELEQTINFVIDKTAPELIFQFNPTTQDLDFSATDTLPTVISASSTLVGKLKFHLPKVLDSDNVITATDSAGNTTVLTFKDKGRKRNLKADIKSLSYNSVLADINKLLLHFNWEFGKQGLLKELEQQIHSKKDFNIESQYENGKTKLEGRDQTGKIHQTLNGLILLKVFTNNGDLGWGM